MNFTKLSLIVVPAMLLLGAYLYFGKLDHADPIAVANAFTAAVKHGDTAKASTFVAPDKAEAWLAVTDKAMDRMKSEAARTYLGAIPSTPGFVAVEPLKGKPVNADLMSLKRSDGYLIEMSRTNGKWWVSKAAT